MLPDDRADMLYHRYDGGGVTIDGPSVLVRKKFGESSVSANYYVDMVSSASIDVVTTASPYTEGRTQRSLGADYLQGKTIYSSATRTARRATTRPIPPLGISQDMFGDLTTVSLGFCRGWDKVARTATRIQRSIDRRNYRLGVIRC